MTDEMEIEGGEITATLSDADEEDEDE